MEKEVQTLIARLTAHRVLPRKDTLVKRALTDDLFFSTLQERLAACGLELVEHPYADNVCLRIRREMEQPVFGAEDRWLSDNLELKRDQMALLVVIWALLVLPKRSRQIDRKLKRGSRQSEMFSAEKPMPSAAELDISITEAALLADFGDRLGGRTRIKNFGLPVLSRLGFIERRDGRIYEGPLLDLALDYNRMAGRVLDGALSDLFGDLADEPQETEPMIDADETLAHADELAESLDELTAPGDERSDDTPGDALNGSQPEDADVQH